MRLELALEVVEGSIVSLQDRVPQRRVADAREVAVDPAFQKAPAAFLDFARAKWKRLVTDAK
jgi:hypothetical protein